jgi:hypothetical protein
LTLSRWADSDQKNAVIAQQTGDDRATVAEWYFRCSFCTIDQQ